MERLSIGVAEDRLAAFRNHEPPFVDPGLRYLNRRNGSENGTAAYFAAHWRVTTTNRPFK